MAPIKIIGLTLHVGNKLFLYMSLAGYYAFAVSWILYTGCPRRKVPDFGRVFLMLKYNDITQNTYVQI